MFGEQTRSASCRSILAVVLAVSMAWPSGLFAASHREAPITALDRTADITDWFAFVSYDDPTKVTFILNVDPLLEPSNGPNYFPFDPQVLYSIRIDYNQDAVEDVVFKFKFFTEIRAPKVFTALVGAGAGLPAPANSPPPVAPGTPVVPPAITALDGPGSEGLNLRQRYHVFMSKKGKNTRLGEDQDLFAVPSNVGPRTMPDYPALAKQGIYDLGNGIRVFAGTVDDPFYIDLGAAFDTLNFRPSAFQSGVAGVLSDAQDANDSARFAPDDVSGFNVNTIALEVPITMLTRDGKLHTADEAAAVIGTWGETARRKIQVRRGPQQRDQFAGQYKQVQRMGNPLINELIIGTGFKDRFSMDEPRNDAQFADFFLDPLLARVINAAYAGAVEIPPPPRTDLLPLVTYAPPIAPPGIKAGPIADLLRLNTGVPPTTAATRRRLGALAGDLGGFPNGRRVSDDVTDITARAVAGVLNPDFNKFPNNRIGDGVNTNDQAYQETFPYVGFAQSGRNSRHIDPGEEGCTPGPCPTD